MGRRTSASWAAGLGALAVLALPACGGGGGGSDEAATAVTPEAAPAAPSAAAPAPVSGTQVEGELTKLEYVSRADSLCRDLRERFEDVEFGDTTKREAVDRLQGVIDDIDGTVTQLRALPLPGGDVGPALTMLDRYGRAARALRRIPRALDDDGSAFVSQLERMAARVLLGDALGNVVGWRYGFRECAGQPVASFEPEADGAALATLQAGREAQMARFVTEGAFTERRLELLELDEDLYFVNSLASLRPGNVYVELADARTMYLGAESESGRCLWLKDREPRTGSDGEEVAEVTYSITENCAVRPTDLSFVGNTEPPPGCGCVSAPQPSDVEPEEAQQARFD